MVDPVAFAVFAAAGYPAHLLADHPFQPSEWAANKGRPCGAGRTACTKHVAVVVAFQAAFVTILALATGLTPDPTAILSGLAFTAWSHYWMDRRFTAAGLYQTIGKSGFASLGTPRPGRNDNPSLGTGAYRMDQDWHILWIMITSLIMASTGAALLATTGTAALLMAAAITASRSGRRTLRNEENRAHQPA